MTDLGLLSQEICYNNVYKQTVGTVLETSMFVVMC